MPGTRCTVAVCNNSYEKTKKAGMKITYHKFPKVQPYRNIWIQKCRRAGVWNPNSCHICSIHFTDEDFKLESFKFTGNKPKRLKSTAIPTLYLLEPQVTGLEPSNSRPYRIKKMIEDENSFKDDYNTVYLPPFEVKAETTDDITTYDSFVTDDSNEISSSENENHITCNGSDLYAETSDEFVENEDCKETLQDFKDFYSDPTKFNFVTVKDEYITVRDKSTQTDTDCLSQKCEQLAKVNENLETEIVTWGNKYKKLIANMRFLESEIQRLKLNATQV